MDEMSEEDLIQAYNDAMALNIKPESADVKFTLQGLKSKVHIEEEMPKIT